MTAALLRLAGVGFGYGLVRRRVVFEGFDWSVPAGCTTLLLGPNGAGKSSLLRLLAGYVVPRAGSVQIDGEVSRHALYRRVGWMPQAIEPVRGLTVAEQVEFTGWLGGMTTRDARASTLRVLDVVDLGDLAGVPARSLSGGQLRRLGLAQALVRESDVLLLDEPTAGLDPAQSANFRRLLGRLDPPGGSRDRQCLLHVRQHAVTPRQRHRSLVEAGPEGVLRTDHTSI